MNLFINKVIKSILILGVVLSFKSAKAATIICITGGTGAGKTCLAQKLCEKIKDDCEIISQDSYYRDLSHLSPEERDQVNFDHPDSIEFDLLKDHLLKLKAGQSIEVPLYSFKAHNRTDQTRKVDSKKVILLEGILLLAVPEIRDLIDIKIFVDVEDDVRLLRRIRRDLEERGRTLESVEKQYFSTVKPMHQKFVAPSRQFADILIPHGAENKIAVDLVAFQLKDLVSP